MDFKRTMYAIADAGLTLTASKTKDALKVSPAKNVTAELAAAIRENKAEIIRVMRENEENRLFRETGIVQSERQVFGLTREFFGTREKRK